MEPSTYYHIYNHVNGDEDLFREEENYHYFLRQWTKYIEPVAMTYAYCLMPNHFHFLIRTKTSKVFGNLGGLDTQPSKIITQAFSNLFNSYTKAFNKKYSRRGSLFMPNFKKKPITSDAYLTAIITYIHRNPVHHGFCD
ncbi:MAG: transposase [Cyclobacteriaceae bacterium]